MTQGARGELLPLSELGERDLRAWAELSDRAAEPNPYLHPDFVIPAARVYDPQGSLRLAVAGGADGWRACLPARHQRQWRRLPVPGTLAFNHDQCFLGTPLLDREDPTAAVTGLFDVLAGPGAGAFAELDHTDTAGPVGAALDEALPPRARRFGGYDRAALVRRPEPTYLEGRLKGKHRRSLGRLARDLEERFEGELELTDRAGEAAAVAELLTLESTGWKGERGTALASTPGGREFFESMCGSFAARGALQLLFLAAGGHTVAVRCNLRAGDVILCFKIAFDEELRRYSPGMQMELRMIDHFHADATAARMDSCADPRSEMFNRLWPDRRPLGGVLVPAPRLAGRAADPALRAVGRAIDRHRAPDAA